VATAPLWTPRSANTTQRDDRIVGVDQLVVRSGHERRRIYHEHDFGVHLCPRRLAGLIPVVGEALDDRHVLLRHRPPSIHPRRIARVIRVVRIASMPGAQVIARSAGGALAGAGLGELSVRGARRLPAEQRVTLYAAGLSIVAAIYPAARRRWRLDRSSAGELLGVIGYATASVLAIRRPRPLATRLLAAGWASHALFDVAERPRRGLTAAALVPGAVRRVRPGRLRRPCAD
jgi:hypothetical protein